MQPSWELSLQKAVCLVPGWPRLAGVTFLGPSCLQRCWPWAGSCLLLVLCHMDRPPSGGCARRDLPAPGM